MLRSGIRHLYRRSRLVLPCLVLLLFLPSSPGQATTRLVSVPASTAGLAELGLALDDATERGGRVLIPADDREVAQLERAGITYETEIADLESYYAERLLAERSLWEGADPEDTPGFGLGSMGGFYTWSEMTAKLDEMRMDYPTLVTEKRSLGVSHEGREIWMAKISDNADQNEGEPAILFTGLTHAREPIGMELILYYMFHLLENYGLDPEVTYLVDERELIFVPVLNPDGYVYNETTNPNGGGLWRKNRRDSGGGIYGVDLNRNYGYQWGFDNLGSSPNPAASNYRGPGPFSEPETSAIRALHQERTIWNAFHYHSYGRYLIHPFAYQATAFPPEPDLSLYLHYGGVISAMNGYLVGNFDQTLGYLANGDAIDWSYGEQVEKNKVFAFLPEVGSSGDGFWPAPSRIVPLAEENLGPNLYYSWIAGARAELVGVAAGPRVPVGATSPAVVELANDGLGATATDVTVMLATSDPHVTIAEPEKTFPALPPLGVGSNASDPLEFYVLPGTPPDHVITFDLTVRQGGVFRDTESFQVTTQAQVGTEVAEAPELRGLTVRALPNPMDTGTRLELRVPAATMVEVSVVDMTGRVRRILTRAELDAGEHRLAFDGHDENGRALPAGIYLVRVTAGAVLAESRLVILR